MASRYVCNRLLAVVAVFAMAFDCWAQLGDVDGDGSVDVADINVIVNIILGQADAAQYDGRADINDDGLMDITDLGIIVDAMINTHVDLDDKSIYREIALPMLEIYTVDGELPTYDPIEAPEGAFGKSITNATKVPGRMVMTLLGDTVYDSGEYAKGVSGMTLKITGNTSAYGEIKPYKIKLQAKADLLCRDDSIYGDKEWRLLRDDRDLNIPVGLMVNQMMGLQWTPQYSFCNLFINDKYEGLYILCETVKRNRSCRIDVEKSGYIVERDAYWWNEDVSFKSSFFNDNRYGWTFKYPDDEITEEDVDYMSRCINAAEASIDDGTYPEHIDVESFVNWLMAHDLLGTWDSGGSNLYITKRDSTRQTLLEMGCLWDFDSNRGMGLEKWSRYHISDDFYYLKLFNSANRTFAHAYTARWNEILPALQQQLNDNLDSLASSPTAAAIDRSREYHCKLYSQYPRKVSLGVQKFKEWFEARIPWLNEHIGHIK